MQLPFRLQDHVLRISRRALVTTPRRGKAGSLGESLSVHAERIKGLEQMSETRFTDFGKRFEDFGKRVDDVVTRVVTNERLPLALFAVGVGFAYYFGSKIDELHAKIDRKIDQQAVELENVKNAIHLMSVQMGYLFNGKTNAD